MKTTFLTPALVAILGLALAGAPVTAKADATTNAPAATPPAAAPAKVTKTVKTPYTGTITAVDATSVTITGKKNLTLAITPATKFKKDGTKCTVTDIAVGDKVTGSFFTDDTGTMTASSIHAKTVAAAK